MVPCIQEQIQYTAHSTGVILTVQLTLLNSKFHFVGCVEDTYFCIDWVHLCYVGCIEQQLRSWKRNCVTVFTCITGVWWKIMWLWISVQWFCSCQTWQWQICHRQFFFMTVSKAFLTLSSCILHRAYHFFMIYSHSPFDDHDLISRLHGYCKNAVHIVSVTNF